MWVRKFALSVLMLGCGVSTGHAEGPTVWREPQTGMEFVWVAKACYQMGSSQIGRPPAAPHFPHSPPHPDESPAHEVCLDGFWLGKYEVTRAQWARVMGNATQRDSERVNEPVTGVSWIEARTFAERLGAKGERYRLPTEAEWEYACLAGSPARVYDPDDLEAQKELHGAAWIAGSSGERRKAQPVGKKKPNAWGFHDMLGNVWEWVQDGYEKDAYSRHALYNPVIEVTHDSHVIRGSSFRSQDVNARCGERNSNPASEGLPVIGFRLVRDAGKRP